MKWLRNMEFVSIDDVDGYLLQYIERFDVWIFDEIKSWVLLLNLFGCADGVIQPQVDIPIDLSREGGAVCREFSLGMDLYYYFLMRFEYDDQGYRDYLYNKMKYNEFDHVYDGDGVRVNIKLFLYDVDGALLFDDVVTVVGVHSISYSSTSDGGSVDRFIRGFNLNGGDYVACVENVRSVKYFSERAVSVNLVFNRKLSR